jgi:cobalt-zinc-cadmium resistance protein CzcA
MMNSAILTVNHLNCIYPNSFSGIEGKMFKPMAMTFSFALVGAMIFCFTYVPCFFVVLKPKEENPNSFSSRLIRKLKSWYLPL